MGITYLQGFHYGKPMEISELGFEPSALPALADACRAVDLVAHCAELAARARDIGVPVLHCTAETRGDLRGANRNARLFMGVLKAPVRLLPGSEAVQVPPEIGVAAIEQELRAAAGQ